VRVLIAFQGRNENCYGMAPLGWALRTAGHEVWVAGQPEATDMVADTGLTMVPLGRDNLTRFFRKSMRGLAGRADEEDAAGAFQQPEELTWEELKQWYRRAVPGWWKVINEPMLADLTAFCQEWQPDLVLWEAGTYAAPIAAQACGAAHARVVWSVDLFARLRDRFLDLMAEQSEQGQEDLLGRWLGSRAAARGHAFSEELTRGHFTVDCFPASLAIPHPQSLIRVPARYVPYSGRTILPAWLRDEPERPRVAVCTTGSADTDIAAAPVPPEELLDALAGLDVEVVLTVADAGKDKLPRLPDNVRVADTVPPHQLAPSCAAMISYGDPGTVCTALLHGVPQLVIPAHDLDAPLLARAVASVGAGAALTSGARTRDQVTALLDDPAYRQGAGRVSAEMRAMPAPNEVVTEIEELTAKHRTR
jgi:glycosyltransferase (activator-dependent family)